MQYIKNSKRNKRWITAYQIPGGGSISPSTTNYIIDESNNTIVDENDNNIVWQ